MQILLAIVLEGNKSQGVEQMHPHISEFLTPLYKEKNLIQMENIQKDICLN
jgi:hypothetical protein